MRGWKKAWQPACRLWAATIAIMVAWSQPSTAQSSGSQLDLAISALIAAYPDHLSHRDGNTLVWLDGTRMVIDDGLVKDHDARLGAADIEDMLSQVYMTGRCSFVAPQTNQEPGRIRDEAFFRGMYGDTAAEVAANLVTVDWFGTAVAVTSVNGVDQALTLVRDDLARLPAELRVFFTTTAGTFNWRQVAGTERLSVHSFGAAIDLNVALADYWLWSSPTGRENDVPSYRNRFPADVVEAFERHGFIWGGKWFHFDTMHFEYRPELIARSQVAPC